MAVRKDESRGKWLAEAYVKGKRVRRWFDTKGEANRFFNTLKQENSPLFQAIQVQKEQPQRLSELVEMWYHLHGQTLVKGETRFALLKLMCDAMGDPLAKDFTIEHFVEYRKKRLNGEIYFGKKDRGRKIKFSTLNFEQSSLKAVFNELKRFKKWQGENPLGDLRLIKEKEKEITFLRSDEIQRLLSACKQISKDLTIAVSICLATGARWGEVENLKGSQLIPYKVTFTQTKGGKNRTVPISKELYEQIEIKQGKLFNVSNRDFQKAIKLAQIELPNNKLTHILRHTFASHFMMNGGNILVLKDILGHSSITITMIYAHFAPSYLETATTLNPLANLDNPVAV